MVTESQFKYWTEEEIKIVKLHYKGKHQNIKTIMQLIKDKCHINRSYYAIRHEASNLGLTKNKGKIWTTNQEKELINYAGSYTPQQIAFKMKRTLSSIHHKMQDLGLNGRDRIDWYTMGDVCEILGVCDDTFNRWVKSGKLKASFISEKSTIYQVGLEDLRNFIRRYPLELTGRNVDMSQIVQILSGG